MLAARVRGSDAAAGEGAGVTPGGDGARPPRKRLNPHALAYLIGPAALVVVLALRWFGLVAQEPVWLWLAVFVTIPAVSIVVEYLYLRRPTGDRMYLRVAWHVAAVTVVIYLSGWGPVMVGAFAFVALENISDNGSRTWRMTAFWSLLGVAVGQLAIWQHWAPSFLSVPDAEALGLMGVFVLLFVIRMAAATMGQKEEAEDRFRSLVQHSSDTTLVVDEGMLISYASPATTALLGTTPDKVVGRRANEFVHPDDRERVESQFAARLLSNAVTEPVQFRMAHTDSSWRYVEAVVSDLRDRPSVAGYVANVRDISERKEAENRLAHQALHDPLTGLSNRTLILDRADQMLVRARRDFRPTAALFVDLDNFKDINDTLGHEAGDKVLQAVANRFTALLRAGDTVGRLGGDEFVVLVEGISLAAGPELVAERLQSALREPFRIEGYEGYSLTLSASIGIAVGDRDSAEDLLRDADIALYRAKALGKNRFASFEPEMQSSLLDRLELRMDLHSALANNELFLLYQPVVDLEKNSTRGVEALLRWHHPVRGMVLPGEFISLLEESGLIVEVGRWVLRQACQQAADWNRRGYHLVMSVNVSMRQLETDTLVDHVREALADSHLDPGSLVLEVTETTIMRDASATIRRLRGLKELGILIAIDDFGTGYSSLAHLQQFPVDALKIDQSFISAMADSPESAALIHTLVELGRALGLETVAEGIEDRSQLERLRSEGCHFGQGFLFSHPVSPDAFEAYLAQSSGGGVAHSRPQVAGSGSSRPPRGQPRKRGKPGSAVPVGTA
jgi:diguanylate cyclase (GGDEF)-like protein/PAS domain S-box-containing protein